MFVYPGSLATVASAVPVVFPTVKNKGAYVHPLIHVPGLDIVSIITDSVSNNKCRFGVK